MRAIDWSLVCDKDIVDTVIGSEICHFRLEEQ